VDQFQSIQIFIRVTTAGNFTRASEQLNVSRAVITRHIAELENRLQTRLIHRNTRRLSLTETGQIFLERTRHIVEQLADAEEQVTSYSTNPVGRLRIVAPVTFGQETLR
jgi:DNA-binding transcriptional LysR family regulator